MQAKIEHSGHEYKIDLSKPLDISIPIKSSKDNVNAWYIDPPNIQAEQLGDWTASVKLGASVNFNTIKFNPHAHGTHTECVGHITEEVFSINQYLRSFFFLSQLITITPVKKEDDFVIGVRELEEHNINPNIDAVVIRTLPNSDSKITRQYSHTNPPYLTEEAAQFLVNINIKHLLIDLPSIDKEKDEGKLLAHNAFWQTSAEIRMDATITEFIYVNNDIKDGLYFLNLQIAAFENDASPSKPLLFNILD